MYLLFSCEECRFFLLLMFPACAVLFAAAFVLGFLLLFLCEFSWLPCTACCKCNGVLTIMLAACVFIFAAASVLYTPHFVVEWTLVQIRLRMHHDVLS